MTERLPLRTSADEAATYDEDQAIVARVLRGEIDAFAELMRRHNQRLYRVCRSVLPNDGEAEEAVQEAYLRAYRNLAQFEGRAKFSTWLTRIALHEALARRRRSARWVSLQASDDHGLARRLSARGRSPERDAMNEELSTALEKAIDALPAHYRTVLVLRLVEGLSTDETASCLGLGREAVKSRLHRSRKLLQVRLRTHAEAHSVFGFLGSRCDRLVARVLAALQALAAPREAERGEPLSSRP